MRNLELLLTIKITFSSSSKQSANPICMNNGKQETIFPPAETKIPKGEDNDNSDKKQDLKGYRPNPDLSVYAQNPKSATCTFEQFRWDNNADKPFTAMGGAKLRCLNLYRTTDTPRPVCPAKQDTKVLSLDELALIRSEPISIQWTNELRKNVGLYPSCKLLRELLSLDVYTRTVIYPLLIKGWSSSRIADRLKVSTITIQKLLEIGREQLKRKLAPPR